MKTVEAIDLMEGAIPFAGEKEFDRFKKPFFQVKITQVKERTRLYLRVRPDKPGILYTISALFYIYDINVVEAHAATSPGGEVCDTFLLEPAEKKPGAALKKRDLKKLVRDLERFICGKESVVQYLRDQPEKWKALTTARKSAKVDFLIEPTSVESSGEVSLAAPRQGWVISFGADDRPGLLYDLTKALYLLYFDVLELESETSGKKAFDRIMVCKTPGRERSIDAEILHEALSRLS